MNGGPHVANASKAEGGVVRRYQIMTQTRTSTIFSYDRVLRPTNRWLGCIEADVGVVGEADARFSVLMN